MKVIVKHPGMEPEVIDVGGIPDINKLTGNIDENGNGLDHINSDMRGSVAPGVDEYLYAKAAYNSKLGENLWSSDDVLLYCGTIVFAGYDKDKTTDWGACSLTEGQIEWCLSYIARQEA